MPNAGMLAVGVVGVMLLVFGGIYVVDFAAQDSRHDITITNESFTPTASVIELNNSKLDRADYDSTVTVRFANGTAVDSTGNYTWHANNGTIEPTGGSQLAAQSTATITYGYEGQTLSQTRMTNLVIDTQDLMRPAAFVAAVALIGVVLLALGRSF